MDTAPGPAVSALFVAVLHKVSQTRCVVDALIEAQLPYLGITQGITRAARIRQEANTTATFEYT